MSETSQDSTEPAPTNAKLFFDKEDHTLGNLMRKELLENPNVLFAAYKVPHPLDKTVEIRIQTMEESVTVAMETAIDSIVNDINEFERAFNEALAQ